MSLEVLHLISTECIKGIQPNRRLFPGWKYGHFSRTPSQMLVAGRGTSVILETHKAVKGLSRAYFIRLSWQSSDESDSAVAMGSPATHCLGLLSLALTPQHSPARPANPPFDSFTDTEGSPDPSHTLPWPSLAKVVLALSEVNT